MLVGVARSAAAIEAFDGRLQMHGFYEMQTRILARDFNVGQDSHLAQWWNILNLEIEWDAAPEGIGPFDLVSTFVRLEARYDLMYQSQYYLPSYLNRYGNSAKRLPKRLSDGRKNVMIGQVDPGGFGDKRNLIQLPLDQRIRPYGAPNGLGLEAPAQRHLGFLWNVPGISEIFFAGPGPDRVWGIDPRNGQVDDSGFYVGAAVLDYRFGVKRLPGNVGGNGRDVLGPYRPKDTVPAPGLLRDRANPLRGPCEPAAYDPSVSPASCDLRPALKDPLPMDPMTGAPAVPGTPATPGDTGAPTTALAGGMPYRPAPLAAYYNPDPAINSAPVLQPLDVAQGLYIPNAGFVNLLRNEDTLDFNPDQNFEQWELALNWGASQRPWRILREAYVDVETFDHHLWLRAGLQTIVWGKTEIFRAQDQFNPQDLGIASLPSLEESRVPLLALRGVWSFYDVGPFEDVRLEGAINWDRFVPIDPGRCGEAFAPRPACNRSFAMLGNALVGSGIAGELRPGYPWEDPDALEGGVRVEFRRDRVSYALTWFNGREDSPFADPVFVFERNVDPDTGWPRVPGSAGSCDPVAGEFSSCLGSFTLDVLGNPVYDADHTEQVLANHHANQQLFHVICATTVGIFASLSEEACGFTAWNSLDIAADPSDALFALAPTLSSAFSTLLAGQGANIPLFNGATLLSTLGRFDDLACGGLCPAGDMPLVALVQDPGDYLPFADTAWFNTRLAAREPDPVARADLNFRYSLWRPAGVARYLNDAQEALIGCGRHWGTDCDVDGFDIMNGEASVLLQSWPGFEGTGLGLVSTFQPGQPGTEGFAGGPVCTRFEGGVTVAIAGCFDGTAPSVRPGPVNPAVIPITGQTFELIDGVITPVNFNCSMLPAGTQGCTPVFQGGHPFTGEAWASELAALSWNLLMTNAALSLVSEANDSGFLPDGSDCATAGTCIAGNGLDDLMETRGQPGRFDEFSSKDPYSLKRCSFALPQLCKNVIAVLGVSRQAKKTIRAGGNELYGRRDFTWHGGAQVVLNYPRRNVVGFALDFAEDRTRTNWNMEFTWFHRQRWSDLDSETLHTKADSLNLVVSLDRPTFVRFMNKHRTFFFNAQVFLRYLPGYRESFVANGPVTATMTFGAFTGYYQDRLIPSFQFVYDFGSFSGGILYGLGFRVTESFLIQVGMNAFWGNVEKREAPLVPVGTGGGSGAGSGQHHAFVETGLAPVRDRDELFFRIRWTF